MQLEISEILNRGVVRTGATPAFAPINSKTRPEKDIPWSH